MELTAEQIVSLTPIFAGDAPAGALAAAVEYRTPHGCGYFPVTALLADAALQAPELAALPAPYTLKFLQLETGAWQAVFTAASAPAPVVWDVAGTAILEALRQGGFPAQLLSLIDNTVQQPAASEDAPPWAE